MFGSRRVPKVERSGLLDGLDAVGDDVVLSRRVSGLLGGDLKLSHLFPVGGAVGRQVISHHNPAFIAKPRLEVLFRRQGVRRVSALHRGLQVTLCVHFHPEGGLRGSRRLEVVAQVCHGLAVEVQLLHADQRLLPVLPAQLELRLFLLLTSVRGLLAVGSRWVVAESSEERVAVEVVRRRVSVNCHLDHYS